MIGSYEVRKAEYPPHPSRRYAGNPHIETLRIFDGSADEIHSKLAHYPDRPTDRDRRKSETTRSDDLHVVKDIVYPRPAYKIIAAGVLSSVKEAYHARNPISLEDRRRRQLIAQSPNETFSLPSNWKSSAQGITLLGPSGSGKTTL